MKLFLASLALVLASAFGLTACSTPAPEPLPADAVVIDVRTPAEYDAGHLEGAENIDVQSGDFDARMAALPTSGNYVVYCQSGNRSAAAVARMSDLGFSNVTDAGGMSSASGTTGLPIVTAP